MFDGAINANQERITMEVFVFHGCRVEGGIEPGTGGIMPNRRKVKYDFDEGLETVFAAGWCHHLFAVAKICFGLKLPS
jgi:hypothetical protein